MPPLTQSLAPREDCTLVQSSQGESDAAPHIDCCLVQIYPADVIDGMLLLEKSTVTVGREFRCDLSLEDASVSRRHAEFHRTGAAYEVVDLNSTNGTLVNGELVTSRELRSGDCIKVGCYLFKFLSAGSIEAAYHETVYSAMTIDALTGAFNKSYLLDNLRREIVRCQRRQRPLAVVMSDIDRFKLVNDTHGHLVGDEVLKEFGARISKVCREDELFARYGGEEFSLVLPETSLAEAMNTGERCRQAVADEPFETNAGPLTITASFGVAILDDDRAVEPETLINEADQRLYQAKNSGRNRVVGPAL